MKPKIRNFSIIAHIDHGKTTLTDRILEITKTIDCRLMHERYLDSHPISQERGVTIKLAPVRMKYIVNSELYILNLIDTPGHIDFSYEVSRSLAACEGAVLLIDATQGIQAQTLAHFYLARKLGIVIIPVINKIDLSNANPKEVARDLEKNLGFANKEMVFVSAKNGTNVELLLKQIIARIPSPKETGDRPFRAMIFDSIYHPYKGVIIYLRVFDGNYFAEKGKFPKSSFVSNKQQFEPVEIGFFMPQMKKTNQLLAGEVGYIATGLKEISLAKVGDTIGLSDQVVNGKIKPLPGYVEPKPMVFFDFYPENNNDFPNLADALLQLKLNDSALLFSPIGSPALGKGFRVGFLGVFHALITQERLERDYNLNIIITTPSVEYHLILKDKQAKIIRNASEIIDLSQVLEIKEPLVKVSIFTPVSYIGQIYKLCQESRGKFINQQYFGSYTNLEYLLPLVEMISGFYDRLKSVSSGFASLDYALFGYEVFSAVKLEVLIHRQKIDALSMLVAKEKSEQIARNLAKKLKEVVPRQQFEVKIQIALNNKIVASETIKAFRKDVTQKLYGGDQTRKDKLLKKQKKGKKRMKLVGRINLPQEAFMAVLEVR